MSKFSRFMFLICVLSMVISLFSCAAVKNNGGFGGYYDDSMSPEMGGTLGDASMDKGESDAGEDTGDDSTAPEEVYLPSGMITAGAWVDNDNYEMWLELFAQGEPTDGKFYEYTNPDNSWGFNSLNRVKVSVTNGYSPVAGATVIATDDNGKALFSAVSDAHGNAYIFTDSDSGNISVTSGEGKASAKFSADERDITIDLDSAAEKLNVIEIMLVLDVTGSMGDEIRFLKAELADVINKVAANNSGAIIKLAMLFYRDTDDLVPFDYYDFTNVTEPSGMNAQQNALNQQIANGGGDYPEAVDEALNIAVNKQWSTGATTKIVFFVLDAPAHNGVSYRAKFENAVKIAAEKGIRLCPILCSGAAALTEYTMREAAIYTGGTFIFVTDDSGIGGSHHDPQLPNVTVELLNSLMVRVVNGYHTGEYQPPVYWKDDPYLANK